MCSETLPADCFGKGMEERAWCEWASKSKRAKARYADKVKPSSRARNHVSISKDIFVKWYEEQEDCCAYCGLTFDQLKQLRIRRKGGYCVAWDIDRVDSSRPYEPGNLALACFVCNMAKGDMLSAREALIVGQAVHEVWNARLLLNRPG